MIVIEVTWTGHKDRPMAAKAHATEDGISVATAFGPTMGKAVEALGRMMHKAETGGGR